MKALIFAAGRGERMRPLSEHTPKPLLEVGGKPLIAWHLEKLARFGVSEAVINTSHLAEQFPRALGDGARYGLKLHYSHEGPAPLETGGGMLNALGLLGDAPFIAISADIWSDFDLADLPAQPEGMAHLVLVDNPAQHPDGDFALRDGRLCLTATPRLTYSGIGVYRPQLLAHWQDDLAAQGAAWGGTNPPRFKLVSLLRAAIARGQASGQHTNAAWCDVGTPQRLAELREMLALA